jgi:UDP-N-acetylmuramate dehydrogenase
MPKFKENVPLSKFSHYKIGGPARFFFEAKNEKEVAWAIAEAKKRKLPVFILAGGTNLLLSDKGFDGLVLRPAITTLKMKKDGVLKVGAGVLMRELLDFTAPRSLSGLEWAGGLPGTIGGAIRGNAGCFGGETKDNIVSIRSFDTKTMKFVERSAKACAFKYRDSVFKKKHGAEIILSATLKLAKGDKKAIARSIKEKIEYRKKNHPLEYPNIGSTFKNVPLHTIHKKGAPAYNKALAARELVFRGSRFSIKTDPFPVISAAKLISESGLRGVSAGGAMISPKHPNFIVNVLNASSCDAKSLIILAKAEVYKKFGIPLEEEIQVV